MASITTDAAGNKRIKFYDLTGRQRSVRIGKINKKTASLLCEAVEQILSARRLGHPLDGPTADRLSHLSPQFREKFERVGLLATVDVPEQILLGHFLKSYIDGRSDLKPGTVANLQHAAENLLTYFGEERTLDSITAGHADEFRVWTFTRKVRPLAKNTSNRLASRSKQFFEHAYKKKIVSENPFGHLKSLAVRGTRERQRFIERETITRVIAACPNADWRLIVSLCRFGGLRISEACNLRWDQIDWDQRRIRVRCEKTEHHEGREWREIPFFPEIVPHLEESWELAPERAEMVIEQYRTAQNLRKPFQDILANAEIEVWPKPFQNLRSTRETELLREGHPEYVVVHWLGNTPKVAREHYLQITELDYLRAEAPAPSTDLPRPGPKSGPAGSGRERQALHPGPKATGGNPCRTTVSRSSTLGATTCQSREKESSYPARIRT